MVHAFDIVDSLITARRHARHLLLGLDFDGTIAPIVPRVEDATLPSGVLDVLRSLMRRADTWLAILSGRSLADIQQRVPLEQAFYAGNHGLEIAGPGLHRVHERAESTRALMGQLAVRLEAVLAPIAGFQLENKVLTLSVHYRRVHDEQDAARLRAIVERECAPYSNLRLTPGKRVVEVRPDIDWDKGSALHFLRATIVGPDITAPTVFIGDDHTDEDGFREVGDVGYGIVVADPPPARTAARAYLRSPAEVTRFLRRLDPDGWTEFPRGD